MRYIITAILLITCFSLFGSWSDYSYYKSHVINQAAGASTNYQVQITVHYGAGSDSGDDVYLNSHTQADFDDVAFFDNDQSTQLDCWLQEYTASTTAIFWVEVADNLGSGNVTIYIAYGDADGTSQSNGDNTFLFFDDFNDASINGTKWDTNDAPAESGGYAVCDNDDGFRSDNTFAVGCAFKILARCDEQDWGMGIRDNYPGLTINRGTMIQNTDIRNPDDFDMFELRTGISTAAYTVIDDDSNADFRNTWYTYEVTWEADTCRYYQNEVLMSTITTNITSTATNVGFGTWDSSQESQLDVDWIILRDYVSPEPTHGAWGEETGISIITIDQINDFNIADIEIMPQ